MSSLKFEWDGNKNALNQRKHGVSFEEAKSVFADELARLIPDPNHSAGEERFILLGVSASLRLIYSIHGINQQASLRCMPAMVFTNQWLPPLFVLGLPCPKRESLKKSALP